MAEAFDNYWRRTPCDGLEHKKAQGPGAAEFPSINDILQNKLPPRKPPRPAPGLIHPDLVDPAKKEAPKPPEIVQPLRIPTLHQDRIADKNDRTGYQPDSPEAKIYIEAKDSVVQIIGFGKVADNAKAKGKGKDGRFAHGGSGFFLSEDGKILTDYHVVRDTDTLLVKTTSGKQYNATIEKVDVANDLALIKIDSEPGERFKPLKLGGQNLAPGEKVYALGHPKGWKDIFISPGVIEQTETSWSIRSKEPLHTLFHPIRTTHTAKIHIEGGNSGGPLLIQDGKVVGVLKKGSAYWSNETIGTFTTVKDIKRLLNHTPDEMPAGLRLLHSVAHGVSIGNRALALHRGVPGTFGSKLSIGLGAIDLVGNDIGELRRSLSHGTAGDIVSSSLQVGADLLLIGGGIAGFSSKYRLAGGLASIAGSVLKLGNDYRGFSRHFH